MLTYHNTCDVNRKWFVDSYGSEIEQLAPIYTSIPCYFWSSKKKNIESDDFSQNTDMQKYECLLDVNNNNILVSDIVKVYDHRRAGADLGSFTVESVDVFTEWANANNVYLVLRRIWN